MVWANGAKLQRSAVVAMASDVLLSAFNGFEDSVILRQLP